MPVTFGIEEEFVLLDRSTLAPVDLAPQAVADLHGQGPGTVAPEFFRSQVEYATPICVTFADARDALVPFRRSLAEWAADAGVVAAGTGTPFRCQEDPTVTASARYERIAADIGGLVGDHQINGLHVHVGIPDRDAGIRASNALRPWLPVLLALSGNSPFWHARDTRYDSWRAIHSRRWTTHGIPPRFRDSREYDQAVAALMGVGAISDMGCLNWIARLSEKYPTLEVRVCDAQLDAESSVALATVIRALVMTGFSRPERMIEPCGDAALWHAARHGVGADLVHPIFGRLVPATQVLRALHDHIAPMLHGDDEIHAVEALLSRSGNGARRQRAASAAGLASLVALYDDGLVAARTLSR
jgi:carboxylate-amine ligase